MSRKAIEYLNGLKKELNADTQVEFGQKIGISQGMVSRITKRGEEPGRDVALKISEKLNRPRRDIFNGLEVPYLDTDILFDLVTYGLIPITRDDVERIKHMKGIEEDDSVALLFSLQEYFGEENVAPFHMPADVGMASAGSGEFYQLEFPQEYEGPALFMATVVGDSMNGAYQHGDRVLFSNVLDAVNGDDLILLYEGQTYFKRMVQNWTDGRGKRWGRFESLNPDYNGLPDKVAWDDIIIRGKVVDVLMGRKDLENLRLSNIRLNEKVLEQSQEIGDLRQRDQDKQKRIEHLESSLERLERTMREVLQRTTVGVTEE